MKTFDVYPLFDIVPVKAKGAYIWNEKGDQYLDLYGGHAVISVGHGHPLYLQKLTGQLHDIAFYSNSVKIPAKEELAEKLGELSGCSEYSLFLCNSGAEANENALKLASFHNGRKKVIAFKGSFHGRTSAAVAATDDPSIIAPVNANENIIFLPLNDEQAFEDTIISHEICAVIVEGIQGVGGVRLPSPSFLRKLVACCEASGAVLILDEVQSGYGRTGKFFAHQHAGIQPDLITVAKGMGNGFPVAGVLIHPKFKARHGMLGTTFGGNYLACAAAIAVLDIIREEKLAENAAEVGDYLINRLKEVEGVCEVRGKGLMIGVELEGPCAHIRKQLLEEHRIFTGSSSDKNTIRILPPLVITRTEADTFIGAFRQVMAKAVMLSNIPI
jgi:acetylornithine/N-succinyldiaminopimelate aminotransferase